MNGVRELRTVGFMRVYSYRTNVLLCMMVSVSCGHSGLCVFASGGQYTYEVVNREFGVRVWRSVRYMWVYCVCNSSGFSVIVRTIMVKKL